MDSVFAAGKIRSSGKIEWEGSSVVQSGKCVTLALDASNNLYGILRSKGLYEVRQVGKAGFSLNPVDFFNATGLLSISGEHNIAVAAENMDTSNPGPSFFNKLRFIDLHKRGELGNGIYLKGTDADNDIFIAGDSLYATGENDKNQRIVGAYDFRRGFTSSDEIPIDSNSVLRLAAYSAQKQQDYLLVSIADEMKVVRIRVQDQKMQLDDGFRIPVQPFPVAIGVNQKLQRGYVLNTLVNTLTAMTLPKVFYAQPAPDYTHEPPHNLGLYRAQAIEAYKDVLSHFLQYLKDCFCDKFLVDCPGCGENEKVYLGVVEVRNGKVYNICNFTKRKYVKSFPTVGYWLSTVPVIPMVNYVFSRLCGKVFNIKEN